MLLHAVPVPLPQPIPASCTTEPLQGSRRRPRHREGKGFPGSCTQQHFAGACAAAELFHTSFHVAQKARGAHVYLCTPPSPSRHPTSPQCLGLSPSPLSPLLQELAQGMQVLSQEAHTDLCPTALPGVRCPAFPQPCNLQSSHHVHLCPNNNKSRKLSPSFSAMLRL